MIGGGIFALVMAMTGGGLPQYDTAAGGALPIFVGQAVCRECHYHGTIDGPQSTRAKGARVCGVEAIPKHDRAFKALSQTEAESIASISGVAESPTESRICMDCHATGADEGRRWWAATFHVEDGVQCEACHGPGSLHVEWIDHSEPRDSTGTGERPMDAANGDIRRADRSFCHTCHVEKPSHKEVLERGYRVSPKEQLYKTPVALAVSSDGTRLYVVCDRANSLIEVDVTRRHVLREVRVGKRPCGIALSRDGRRAFVANRLSGTLSVVDLSSFSVEAEVTVGQEPHGVLVDPESSAVLVLTTGDNSLSIVESDRWVASRPMLMGSGPWAGALDPARQRFYVTNVRPMTSRFRDPVQSELTVVDLSSKVVASRLAVPEANMLQGVTWVPDADITLFTLLRTKNLIPTSRLAQGWVITNGLGVASPGGRVDQVLLDEPGASFPDPMDIAATSNGRWAIVASGGADEVAIIDVKQLIAWIRGHSDRDRKEKLPNYLGSAAEFVVARLPVGANPRGVAISPDGRRAYVANALSDTISIIDVDQRRVDGAIELGGPKQMTELRRGERLFHSAAIAFGHQFSCRSCHPDGHTNGLAFDIEADGIGLHPVDNRTLRGIFDTPPFKWEGTNPTMHRQCGPRLAVFFTRLDPFTKDELDAVIRYICTIEQPPNRYHQADGLTPVQRRGKVVFERTNRNDGTPIPPVDQCSDCHSGAYRTSRRRTAVGTTMWFDTQLDVDLSELFNTDEYGELGIFFFADVGLPQTAFDVPQLRNVVDSPPYLHNGAAATLDEIWTRFNMVDRHGATADLTRQQLNDLIAYLKSQ